MLREQSSRITCQIRHELLAQAIGILDEMGVPEVLLQGGRMVLARPSRLPPLFSRSATSLVALQADILTLTVPVAASETVAGALLERLDLTQPGRGGVYVESVEVLRGAPGPSWERFLRPVEPRRWLRSLVGVTCVTTRDLGNVVARVALEFGTSVPVVTYGRGTGLRNKLGLLRIAVPAEKELVTVVTTDLDALAFMELLVEGVRLDQPGRGFVHLFPIAAARVDTRIFLGEQRHAASIEQIVSAIDDMSHSTHWRRHFAAEYARAATDRWSEGDRLVNLTINCADGEGTELVLACMRAGAGGATTRKATLRSSVPGAHGPARERSDIVVAADSLPRVLQELERAGIFEPEKEAILESAVCQAAFTYRRKTAAPG